VLYRIEEVKAPPSAAVCIRSLLKGWRWSSKASPTFSTTFEGTMAWIHRIGIFDRQRPMVRSSRMGALSYLFFEI